MLRKCNYESIGLKVGQMIFWINRPSRSNKQYCREQNTKEITKNRIE